MQRLDACGRGRRSTAGGSDGGMDATGNQCGASPVAAGNANANFIKAP